MNILISGSSGLIGSAVAATLSAAGQRIMRLVRRAPRPGQSEVQWDPAGSQIDERALDGIDAVIHLAGENIAAARWTAVQKQKLRDSRVNGTRALAEAIARAKRPPKIFLSASAVGYYGDRGDERLREADPAGAGFLPDLCRAWEDASKPAAGKGARIANLRIGIVLSAKGGALKRMLLPFKLGLGGRIGGGRQVMSWISIDDCAAAVAFVLAEESISGPVNIVAPHPVSNAEFTATLGRVLHRPTPFPMPAFAARLAFGEMADALLLAGARVEPAVLNAAGFLFRHPTLESALRDVLA